MSAEYEYKIVQGNSRDDLAKEINTHAVEGWEPINAYPAGMYGVNHAALLRRIKN